MLVYVVEVESPAKISVLLPPPNFEIEEVMFMFRAPYTLRPACLATLRGWPV